jgi:hypothetical protein
LGDISGLVEASDMRDREGGVGMRRGAARCSYE